MHNPILGQDDNLALIRSAIEADLPCLLIGETGTGKTSAVQYLAELENRPCIRFNLTGETTVEDFVGKYTLKDNETKWQDGVLLQAMKSGCWLIVDEINSALPEILFTLHSLLDHDRAVLVAGHEGELVRPHPDFRFFATMNPSAEYAGTKELNRAFLSRFPAVLVFEFPPSAVEFRIIADRFPKLAQSEILKMVAFAEKIRQEKKNNQVSFTCSTRELLNWASLQVACKAKATATFLPAIANKASPEERSALEALWVQIAKPKKIKLKIKAKQEPPTA